MAGLSHTHIRTRDVPWQPFVDIPGFMERPLWYDDRTGARRTIWHLPPGWGEGLVAEEAMLHYHRSVFERSYVLFGDFPHWEFTGFDDLDGYVEVMRAGLFMDRPPLSLHGLKPGQYSQAGAVILYWNTGPGTSIAEPGYAEESVDILASQRDPDLRTKLSQVRLFRPDDLAWQPHPQRAGWLVKPLAGEGQGGDAVTLVFVPPGQHPEPAAAPVDRAFERPWGYVLAGTMHIAAEGGSVETIALEDGDYLDWAQPAGVGGGAVIAGATGCVMLCVGHVLSGGARR